MALSFVNQSSVLQDVLIVPVHENGIHWCLLVVHIVKRQILYCDRYA